MRRMTFLELAKASSHLWAACGCLGISASFVLTFIGGRPVDCGMAAEAALVFALSLWAAWLGNERANKEIREFYEAQLSNNQETA